MRGADFRSITTAEYGETTVEITRLGSDDRVVEGRRWAEISDFFSPARKQVTVRLEWTYRNRVFSEFATGIIYSRDRRMTGAAQGALGGHIRLNPNNSPNNHFYLVMADGTVISRSNLLAGHPGVTGTAQEVRFQPMGAGSQNTLLLEGEPFSMSNSRQYLIEGNPLNIELINTHPGKGSGAAAMGHWELRITSPGAQITVQ